MEKDVINMLFNMSLTQYKRGIPKVSNGHEIFKMNVEDGVIDKPTGTISIEHDKFNRPYKKIDIKFEIGYIYIPALNLKNAHKKAVKIIEYATVKSKDTVPQTHDLSLQAGLEQDKVNT